MSRKLQIQWAATAFFVVLIADQITKAIVRHTLTPGMFSRDVFFHFTHQRNEGLVGGMFSNFKFVTYGAPVFATLVLLYLFRHLDPRSRLQPLAFGMVFGGAIGNIIDRVMHGAVTDFLQFYFYFIPFDFPWKSYPAFNIADSAICVGVFILVLSWNASPPNENVAGTV
jgi:signal peptidase II